MELLLDEEEVCLPQTRRTTKKGLTFDPIIRSCSNI
jgi:hypothetical protein